MSATDQPSSHDSPQEFQESRQSVLVGAFDFPTASAIIGAGVANAITLATLDSPFTLWNSMVGIIILLILQAFPPVPLAQRQANQPHLLWLGVAYAAVWSISLLTAVGVVFNMLFAAFGGVFPDYTVTPFNPFPGEHHGVYTPFNSYDVWFFIMWLGIFALYYVLVVRRRFQAEHASTEQHQDQ
jgi:hypothetical protein